MQISFNVTRLPVLSVDHAEYEQMWMV